MKTIIVKTQKELDELPKSFDEYTEIHIRSAEQAWLSIKYSPDNATIILWESSHAILRGSSHAILWESSHAILRGSSHAELRESSHAILRGNSSTKIHDSSVTIDALLEQSIAICINKKCIVKKKDKTAQVIVCPQVLYNTTSFADIYKNNLVDGKYIILYKSVNPDTLCDFYTGKIKYEGVVTCPDWNPDKNIQCGNGLHLSPTPEMALSYSQGKVLKCKVALKDIAVYGTDITKVRCKKVEVIGEVK